MIQPMLKRTYRQGDNIMPLDKFTKHKMFFFKTGTIPLMRALTLLLLATSFSCDSTNPKDSNALSKPNESVNLTTKLPSPKDVQVKQFATAYQFCQAWNDANNRILARFNRIMQTPDIFYSQMNERYHIGSIREIPRANNESYDFHTIDNSSSMELGALETDISSKKVNTFIMLWYPKDIRTAEYLLITTFEVFGCDPERSQQESRSILQDYRSLQAGNPGGITRQYNGYRITINPHIHGGSGVTVEFSSEGHL
ncbi:MAG: hypothetical protein H6Q00_405 [Holophagaceae bacterium]|nr:hypothetical protein [Holophagaceae bacterium]